MICLNFTEAPPIICGNSCAAPVSATTSRTIQHSRSRSQRVHLQSTAGSSAIDVYVCADPKPGLTVTRRHA
ncbi:hypothetical protein M8J75_012684 [Diaphorina citri]|nr:hypothetical protein M8J75_012684 [Diaphorina citri]